MSLRFRFDRSLLPDARSFYEREVGRLSKPDRKGWALTDCPFHKSKSHKSFSVHLGSGAFHCFGCGAHGGDLIAFVQQRDKISFKTACERLGCWRTDGLATAELQRIERERTERDRRTCELREQAEQEKQERMAALDVLRTLEFHKRQTEKAMKPEDEGTPAQQDRWHFLSLLEDQIRDAEAHYLELCDLAPAPVEGRAHEKARSFASGR